MFKCPIPLRLKITVAEESFLQVARKVETGDYFFMF